MASPTRFRRSILSPSVRPQIGLDFLNILANSSGPVCGIVGTPAIIFPNVLNVKDMLDVHDSLLTALPRDAAVADALADLLRGLALPALPAPGLQQLAAELLLLPGLVVGPCRALLQVGDLALDALPQQPLQVAQERLADDAPVLAPDRAPRSEEHTSELQSRLHT